MQVTTPSGATRKFTRIDSATRAQDGAKLPLCFGSYKIPIWVGIIGGSNGFLPHRFGARFGHTSAQHAFMHPRSFKPFAARKCWGVICSVVPRPYRQSDLAFTTPPWTQLHLNCDEFITTEAQLQSICSIVSQLQSEMLKSCHGHTP